MAEEAVVEASPSPEAIEKASKDPKAADASGKLLDSTEQRRQVRVHYYVKIAVSTFLCALLLIIGVPVFMESRVTGSLAYTALGVVLVGFGLVLAASVITLLFHPPFNKDGTFK